VLQLSRIARPVRPRRYTLATWQPHRRRSSARRRVLIAVGAVVLVCLGVTALITWTAAADNLASFAIPLPTWGPFGQVNTYEAPADGVPVRVQTAPAGAEVRVDGRRAGQTPVLLSVSRARIA
jgi:hypothetical protein